MNASNYMVGGGYMYTSDSGAPTPLPISTAAINDSNEVVGTKTTTGNPSYFHPFKWTSAGGAVDLGVVSGADTCAGSGGTSGAAAALNGSALVVGWSLVSGTPCKQHAVTWSSTGTLTDLTAGTNGSLSGGSNARALAANSSGVVAGWADDSSGKHHAVTWNTSGVITDLGFLPGMDQAEAYGINNSGDIVGGNWTTAAPTIKIPFLSSTNLGYYPYRNGYDPAVLSDSPKAFWPLNDAIGSATAADVSGNGYDATVNSGKLTFGQPTMDGRGLGLGPNGGRAGAVTATTGQGATQSSSGLHPAQYSIEWWQQGLCVDGAGAVGDDAVSISGVNGTTCMKVTFNSATNSPTSLGMLTADPPASLPGHPGRYGTEPHHFVIGMNSGGASLIVDGIQVDSATKTLGAATYSTGNFVIGGTGFDTHYSGGRIIGNVALYNQPLTPAQVIAHLKAAQATIDAQLTGSEVKYAMDVADPVNSFSGSLTHTKVDLSYPGYVYGMAFQRAYNSLDTETTSPLGLGKGWSSSLDTSLTKMADGSLLYRGPEGRRIILASNGANNWYAPELTIGTVSWDGTAQKYTFNVTGGQRWIYDANGRLVERDQGTANLSGPGGQTVAIAYNAQGQPSTVTSSLGFVQRFTYDAAHNNRLTTITGDDDGNQTTTADDRNVTFAYDATNGNLYSATAPHYSTDTVYPVEIYFVDDATHLRTKTIKVRDISQTDSQAVTTADNAFDATTGRVTTQTLMSGDSVTFAYNDGQLSTTATDATSGDVTTYTHDMTGHATGVKDAAGNSTANTYNTGSRVTDTTDPAGAHRASTYDTCGRQTQHATPDPTTGALPARQGDGTFPAPGVNDNWGLESWVYATGTGTVACDARATSHTDATGVTTQNDYDLTNHAASPTPVKVTVGAGSANKTFKYSAIATDGTNHVTGTQDGDGVTSCTYYNTLGQITSQLTILFSSESPVTDSTAIGSVSSTLATTCGNHATDSSANVGRTSFTYTALGQVATTVPPNLQGSGQSWSTAYYGFGQTKTVTDPLGNATGYAYAPTGEVAAETDQAGKITSTSYAWLQPSGSCGSVGAGCKTVTTVGPMDGQYITGTSGNKVDQTTVQMFDKSGDLREVDAPGAYQGATKAVTSYTYGKLGQLTYSHDPDGVVTQYTYDANGNEINAAAGTNILDGDATQTRSYDKLNRITRQVSAKNDNSKVTTVRVKGFETIGLLMLT